MALVDDDQVEEVRSELSEHAAGVFADVGQLLVESEVDLAPCLGLASLELPDR